MAELRCDYKVHALASDQLGRGPYGDSYWTLHVRNGEIIYARATFPFATNGFSAEMWEPFVSFVEADYAGDADVMFDQSRTEPEITPESLLLWEQHIADYVTAETTD